MDSKPPATTTLFCPAMMDCAAIITDFMPEAQTLLIVVQGTLRGRPPNMAAWRAGAWPAPADTTLPRMTSSTSSGDTPERSMAARTATEPS